MGSGKPITVLIVDDSSVMRIAIKNLLMEHYEVTIFEAENGNQAVDKYKESKPDLVTMDINMPEKDGVEALKEILAIDGSAKIIMLTTEVERQRVVECISLGAKSYIVKPMDNERAIEKIKSALG